MQHRGSFCRFILACLGVPGCAASRPPTPAPDTPPVVSAEPDPAPPASSPTTPPSAAPTVYIDWHATGTVEGLEIHVLALEVKQDTDGREVLKGALRLRAAGEQTEASFSGEDSPVVWNGWVVEIRGGSKQAVGVAVTRSR